MKSTSFFRGHLCLASAVLAWAPLCSGQTPGLTNVSAANYRAIVAPGSIVSGWGNALAPSTASAPTSTLPTVLAGVQLSLTDSAGMNSTPQLYMVSPMQINYVADANAALGKGTVNAVGTSSFGGPVLLSNVSPAIFTANGQGEGVAAAQLVANGVVTNAFQMSGASIAARPLNVTSGNAYLVLYGTGIRRHSKNPVIALVGNTKVPVQYAGSQSQFPGFDQVNIGPLPAALAGRGEVDVAVHVDGVPANTVKVVFQ